MPKLQPETRIRTCKACGAQYEYPTPGNNSSRWHCEPCLALKPETRNVLEKLQARIEKLERTVEQMRGA